MGLPSDLSRDLYAVHSGRRFSLMRGALTPYHRRSRAQRGNGCSGITATLWSNLSVETTHLSRGLYSTGQIRWREPVERGLLLNPEWRSRIAFSGRKLAGAKGAMTRRIRVPGILGTLHVKLTVATWAIHIAYFVHFFSLTIGSFPVG